MQSNQLDALFLPVFADKLISLKTSGRRLVYYTTADVAVSIIRKKEIWMRNTAVMNDYLEVEHGMTCVESAWNESTGAKNFGVALDTCIPGSADKLKKFYNDWRPHMRADTFITCISEHYASENEHGRLSMWRAYGRRNGVALVFNPEVMASESDVLGAYSHPVSYFSPEQSAHHFALIAENLIAAKSFVEEVGAEALHNAAFAALRWGALCTKHPGFEEEREWRVVACPSMHPESVLRKEVEVVRGTPQIVLKMDLKNYPEQGLVGLAIPELLNRVIIGPCETPGVIYRAFVSLLQEAGVEKANEKVCISGIPLRQES
jgi:hypothetical protein